MFVGFTTGPDGSVVMSSAKGLVGTGFASRYRLHLYKTKHVFGFTHKFFCCNQYMMAESYENKFKTELYKKYEGRK